MQQKVSQSRILSFNAWDFSFFVVVVVVVVVVCGLRGLSEVFNEQN